MTYFLYMLLDTSNKISYVGYTNNLIKRLNLHNSGKGAKFTRGRKWKLIYKIKCKSKVDAIKQEILLKKNRTLRNKIKSKYLLNIK
ncbi:GIY-YIG nuclease family protein [Candidatus Pelagibacter sp.]|nr:GIY-YIG nuclease family protein [Candidatus Pelagibacter sp.]